MTSRPSNAVLLERIIQVKDQVTGLRADYQSLEGRITTGYVTKDEFVRYITEQKEQQIERQQNYQAQLNSKVSNSRFQVYSWGLNILGGSIITGLLGIFGAMIVRFLQVGAPLP